jgi:type IV secretion system protein VirB1
MELMACPNLAVPAEVMRHIVHVESGSNPYAIGVVGGRLVRQPHSLDEALATAHMLDAKGYNFSLGVAQVNRANLGRYGLDTYEKAFEPCTNLSAGARILAACHAHSGGDWGKSFSCYYSGNFVTGYRDGYVQKVYDSIHRTMTLAGDTHAAQAIPLQLAARPDASRGIKGMTPMTANSAAYRVAIRSVMLDTAATALVPAVTSAAAHGSTPPDQSPSATSAATPVAAASGAVVASAAGTAAADVFVPQVHGPNDPPAAPAPTTAASQSQAVAMSTPAASTADQADLRLENRDAAFVF